MKYLASLFLGVALLCAPSAARAELVYANTTGGRLISFDTATPGTIISDVAITGVAGSLVGIDFRPNGGALFGLSNDGGVGRVYTINTVTGSATLFYTLTTALNGTSFGVDFNPVPDALRIVSDAGQNLRIASPTGFLGALVTNVDTNLSLTGVVGAGYINNFAGTTTTTLYDIRVTDSSLYTQIPPNAGTLNLVGALGTTTNSQVGFDVSGRTGTAFASLNGGNNFGTVNLTTGAFTNIGAIGGGFAGQVVGMSLVTVPEPSSVALLGMGAAGLLGYVRRRRPARG
jgi:hypothetical protein